MFVWTKDKPVKPGWYWMRDKNDFPSRIEYVKEYARRLYILNWPIPDDAEWAGPIPLPSEKHNLTNQYSRPGNSRPDLVCPECRKLPNQCDCPLRAPGG